MNSLVIDLNLKINRDGIGVSGQNLWKLSMWGSGNEDGSGERIGLVDQVILITFLFGTSRAQW